MWPCHPQSAQSGGGTATLNKHPGWGGLYRGATGVSPRAASILFPFPTHSMWGLRVCTGKLFSCFSYVSYVVSYFELTLNPNKQVLLSMEFPVQGSVRTMRLQFPAPDTLIHSTSRVRNNMYRCVQTKKPYPPHKLSVSPFPSRISFNNLFYGLER